MDIDPNSQDDIEQLILDLIKACGRTTVEVGKRAREAAEAETDYRVAYAKAFLKAEGAMDLRTQAATLLCADELHARKMAEGLLLSAQEAGRNARARLDAARTLATNIRAAITYASGVGG
jgi:hypothetical protein